METGTLPLDEEDDHVQISRKKGGSSEDLKNSPYEKKRTQIYEENKNLLEQLGLSINKNVNDLTPTKNIKKEPVKKRKNTPAKKRNILSQSRSSMRVRGEKPLTQRQIKEELDRQKQLYRKQKEKKLAHFTETRIITFQLANKFPLKQRAESSNGDSDDDLPKSVEIPYQIQTISTIVNDFGLLKSGSDKELYTSKTGLPYPVGYKAQKTHFGTLWLMEIKEGPLGEGPIFEVSGNGRTFTGPSPTSPWTEVCLVAHKGGARVSGPLHFGFSDPIVQNVLKHLSSQDGDQVKQNGSNGKTAKTNVKMENKSRKRDEEEKEGGEEDEEEEEAEEEEEEDEEEEEEDEEENNNHKNNKRSNGNHKKYKKEEDSEKEGHEEEMKAKRKRK